MWQSFTCFKSVMQLSFFFKIFVAHPQPPCTVDNCQTLSLATTSSFVPNCHEKELSWASGHRWRFKTQPYKLFPLWTCSVCTVDSMDGFAAPMLRHVPCFGFVNGLHPCHFFAEFMLDTFMLVGVMVFANWYLYIALTVLLNFADWRAIRLG